MEKLSAEQQSSLKKMASERIKEKLIAKGYAADTVEAMDRTQLLNTLAQLMAIAPPEPAKSEEKLGSVGGVVTAAAAGPPMAGGMTAEQFGMWLQWEREKEEIRSTREREAEERRLASEKEREEISLAREREAEDRRLVCEERRLAFEREKHDQLMAAQAAQLNSSKAKAEHDERRANSLTNRAKQVMTTLKDVIGMFPSDPVDITCCC
jgi:hypothetical protein